MCDELAVAGRDEPVVGILESDDLAPDAVESVEDVLEARGGAVVSGSLETVLDADPDLLVAVGSDGVSASVTAPLEAPVLPVGRVPGITAVDGSMVGQALDAVLDGAAELESRTVLDVRVEPAEGEPRAPANDDDRSPATVRGCFDVILDTDEPARISAFSVSSRGERVAAFRADGVVVATPAGSHGYVASVDAPALSPAVDAVTVAPIAPFATRTRRWVLPADDLRLTVERDECTVDLVVDGRPVETLENGWSVHLLPERPLSLVVPDIGHEDFENE